GSAEPRQGVVDWKRMHSLFLAHRTEKRRTPGLHDALHLAGAPGRHTALALAVIDAKMMLEVTKFAIGTAGVAQRRSPRLDCVAQHGPDRPHQPVGAFMRSARSRRDCRCFALG